MRRLLLKPIIFAVAILILGWMVYEADPRQLWQYMLQWNWVLVACIVVWGIGYLLNTCSFGYIIRSCEPETRVGWKRLMQLTIGGYALNYVTPFGLLGGEPWRIYELRKQLTSQAANSAVTYYAMMHVLSHVVFWTIGVVIAMQTVEAALFGAEINVKVIITVMVIVMVMVIVIVNYAIKRGWIASLRQLLQEHPVAFGKALLLELASRMVNVIEYWLLMAVVFPDSALSTYTAAYLVVAFSSLFANLLFFSPLQMGTREGGIFLALQALAPALPELLPVAVSISFATRIREFTWIIIGTILVTLTKKRIPNI